MDIKTTYLTVSRTARYSTYGNLNPNTKYFWFVIHGSKMVCEQMIYKFSNFNPEEHFIVAPEALSKFYLDGFKGDVVSTWMTTRDRLNEIDDFSNYLKKLYEIFEDQMPPNCLKIIMGFSQGGTTMFRWLHQKQIALDILLAYSCWIPEDINLKESKTILCDKLIFYTYGLQDQYLTEKRINALNEIIEKNELNVEFIPFEGIHKIEKKQLEVILDRIVKHVE